MIYELKKNVETEIEILREISVYTSKIEHSFGNERKLLKDSVKSLQESMRLVNDSIPNIVKEISATKKLPSISFKTEKKLHNLENIKFKREKSSIEVVLNSGDKEKFLKELSINENLIRKLKKSSSEEKKKEGYRRKNWYFKLSNRFFFNQARSLINRGYFKSLSKEIRKANIDILFESYVAMILFSTFISVFAALFIAVFLLFFDINLVWPFFRLYDGNYFAKLLKVGWIILIAPVLTFLILQVYPSSEKKSLAKKIERELPFAVIHMNAVSGSGIEPSKLFQIIGLSREYPYLRKEIRKVLNQINLYGYDLVTALNYASKTTPSRKLAELFSGLSTTITSGANLSEFFSKRAESLLLSYRLEREKYTKIAETFLDIYISVVIAAPMIFLLLIIMIIISGIEIGFSPTQISILAVVSVTILNVGFLFFLQLKQPAY